MSSDTVVNGFIVDGRPRSRNFDSIASYVPEMIYTMHSRSHVHACSATSGTKKKERCFASALSWLCRRHVRYFNGVVSFFLSFRFREYNVGRDDLLTGNWKANSIS